MIVAQRGDLLVEGEHILVGRRVVIAGRVRPRVRRAVVGIVLQIAAAVGLARRVEGDLVAVVDRRRAGQRELEQRRQLLPLRIIPQHERQPGRVVAVQQVHHGVVRRRRVIFLDGADHALDLAGRQRVDDAIAVGVVVGEVLRAREAQNPRPQAVVHGRVPLLAEQPAGRIAPFLADDHGFGVVVARRHAEPFPVVVGRAAGVDVAADVQPPAADSLAAPGVGHAVTAHEEIQARLGACAVDLGDTVVSGPRRVIRRAGRGVDARRGLLALGRHEEEPVAPLGLQTLARAFRLEAPVAVEEHAVARQVVERAVQDQHDAARVRLGHQLAKRLQVAQQRVDGLEVGGIVAVVGARLEDRVEVDGGHAQVFEIVQLLDDPGQVAAEEVAVIVARPARRLGHAAIDRRLVPRLVEEQRQVAVEHIRAVRWIVGRVAVAEAIGENLVDHGVAHPARGVERRIVDRDLVTEVGAGRVDGARAALVGRIVQPVLAGARVVFIIERLAARRDDEPVPVDRGRLARIERGFPQVVAVRRGGDDRHRQHNLALGERIPGANRHRVQVARCRPEAERHRRFDRHRAARHPVEIAPAVVPQRRLVDLTPLRRQAASRQQGHHQRDERQRSQPVQRSFLHEQALLKRAILGCLECTLTPCLLAILPAALDKGAPSGYQRRVRLSPRWLG